MSKPRAIRWLVNPRRKRNINLVKLNGVIYRGTQTLEPNKGRLAVTSWSPAVEVAMVYASPPPGNGWVAGSTVHAARIQARALDWTSWGHQSDLYSLLYSLDYGKPRGITRDEADSILQYLHKRELGRTKFSEFKAVYFEEGDEEHSEPIDPPLSFDYPQTRASMFWDSWNDENEDGRDANRLWLDVFAFADAPQLPAICRRLRIQALVYRDSFDAIEWVAPRLLGVKAEELLDRDVVDQPGDEFEFGDQANDDAWTNATVRPMHGTKLTPLWSKPAAEVVATWRAGAFGTVPPQAPSPSLC